ncbi:MAG: hypothetical protein ACFFDT_22980 [Candidatus Hodarchaeota archaeon]
MKWKKEWKISQYSVEYEDEIEGRNNDFRLIFVKHFLQKFLGYYILLSLLFIDVIKLNAVQLLLPKQKTPKKKIEIKNSYAIKTINFTFIEDGKTLPINQVLKTILKLMNEIPVEEEVSWENIRQLRQNYVNMRG